MDILQKFKDMGPEEAAAYLEEAEACAHECSDCGADCASRQNKPAKRVIAVTSGKGGTGKSAVTVLLALALKKRGLAIGILDADISGASVPHMLGMNEPAAGDAERLAPLTGACGIPVVSMALISADKAEPIIWPGLDLAKAAVYLFTEADWPELDVLLVDMPSGAGDIPLEYFTTMPFDGSLIVVNPGALSALVALRAANLAEMLLVPVMGVIENMGGIEPAETALGAYPVAAAVPLDPALREASDEGRLGGYESSALDYLARIIAETL